MISIFLKTKRQLQSSPRNLPTIVVLTHLYKMIAVLVIVRPPNKQKLMLNNGRKNTNVKIDNSEKIRDAKKNSRESTRDSNRYKLSRGCVRHSKRI
jgi:hypothetical protein